MRARLFALAILAVAAGNLPARAGNATAVVTVTTTEFHFALSARSVPHGTVTFVVRNRGVLPHTFQIAGRTTPPIGSRESRSLTVSFARPGTYPYLCAISGHADAGMKGLLTVT